MTGYQHFTVTNGGGVVTVTLDVAGRPLNVLSADVMSELDRIVRDLETSDGVVAVVFRSGKESGFLAGADVAAIAEIESAAHAMQLIEEGQSLFQRIEWLPIPTIAVIHGPCLGGGLEWALACDHRVARDNSSTKIGLPEIKLGLIPGWGGTQRLPRLIGPSNALSMILTGKYVSASKALAMGLVDRAFDPEHWELSLTAFVSEVLRGKVAPSSASGRSIWKRWIEGTRIGRLAIFHWTRKSVASKSRHYPAVAAAIDAVQAGYRKHLDGYQVERQEFSELIQTSTCRNLLDLFFARERARHPSTWSPLAEHHHALPITRIGVIGAGAMGAGIGQLAAIKGYEVAIKEVDAEATEAGRQRIDKLVKDLAKRKKLTEFGISALRKKITLGCDEQLVSDCDLVIEAVIERMDVKQQVFEMLDQVVKPSAMLTSNTSALSVADMASATHRPQQIAGLHFFNPVHRMDLVEVVKASETSSATIGRLIGFVKSLGKTPVVTSDSPGFLVNRVLFPYLGEAVLMSSEGHDTASIDREVRRFGMPMGPLELLDQVGLDVALHVSRSLQGVLPCVGPVADHLAKMVEQGSLGKKSGSGFYHYGKRKPKPVSRLTKVGLRTSMDVSNREFFDDGLNMVQRRLVYPMLCEAVRAHEEGVVENAWAIDLAMVLGTGFAPHRGGPLHMIDDIGPVTMVTNLERLQRIHGNRFQSPNQLIEMAEQDETFFRVAAKDTSPTAPAEPKHQTEL